MDTPTKNVPRDVFLYLLSLVALAMTAVNLGTLLFQYINLYVPDLVADPYFSNMGYYAGIRWAISTLVIVFPVFVWVTRFLQRDMEQFPEKRELKIRKWLLYLTLFVAGMVVMGDLMALVYSFLQGELTLRFLLKILTILFVAGSVFYFYWNELRPQAVREMKFFTRGILAVVSVAILVGFIVVGSPAAQRNSRLDERRISDLQSIQSQVINYWQHKGKLPENLDVLKDDISGFVVPKDPQTEAPYVYLLNGDRAFTLCGDFQTSNRDQDYRPKSMALPYPDAQANWFHDAGRGCFDRVIDPDFYPSLVTPTPSPKSTIRPLR